MKKRIDRKEELHLTQCQFNHGYHDAQYTIERGRNVPEHNYGFGPAIKVTEPDDVPKVHFAKVYATGWTYGYYEMMGTGKRNQSSAEAWKSAVWNGQIKGVKTSDLQFTVG